LDDTVDIFEEAHPRNPGLFIFDNSSAHACLPADALKAFEMNKSDGRKQQLQCDTIILDSNPMEAQHGRSRR